MGSTCIATVFIFSTVLSFVLAVDLEYSAYAAVNFEKKHRKTILCNHGGDDEGVCVAGSTCAANAGREVGSCDYGMVCCKYEASCGSESEASVVYFTNPGFPEAERNELACTNTLLIRRNVCQVKIDFLEFELPIPGPDGVCTPTDHMQIHNPRQPFGVLGKGNSRFCGLNGGQHIYLPVDPLDKMTIVATMSGTQPVPLSRIRGIVPYAASYSEYKWLLRITQIECTPGTTDYNTWHYFQDIKAPVDCLQYFRDTRGKITSFQMDGTSIFAPSQDYSICIKEVRKSCGITMRAYNFGIPAANQAVEGEGCESGLIAVAENEVPEKGPICCTNVDDNGLYKQDIEAYFGVFSSYPPRFRYCGRSLAEGNQIKAASHGPYTIHVYSGNNVPSKKALDPKTTRQVKKALRAEDVAQANIEVNRLKLKTCPPTVNDYELRTLDELRTCVADYEDRFAYAVGFSIEYSIDTGIC